MYSKLSRYHALAEVHAVDAAGTKAVSTSLRPLPATTGELRHAVEAADRLDHLAYKYYRQPVRWWRICDANPDHLSPLALLGKEPLVTARFPLAHDDSLGEAPWPALLRRLDATGVHDVRVEDRIGETTVERAAVVVYNRLEVTPEELADAMAAAGFEVGPPQPLGRVGKEIEIPPRAPGG